MDTKRTWGFLSLLIGSVSLIFGFITISGMIGQTQVVSNMDTFISSGGGDYFHAFSPDYAATEIKHKYQLLLSSGIAMMAIGGLMMRGQWQRY
ncbi:hypothetical protein C9J03_08930 [Photobacterium gaetbulicola]|nr:hypothetical protein [Photobacterium gaetbulicola]KHT62291.1 hypothetical protein RJ45_18085 [Photobacterium gaetbulicola]PSU12686.1 hypothetical protein C9J03_08930 [Photobacterium gaetbulicola]